LLFNAITNDSVLEMIAQLEYKKLIEYILDDTLKAKYETIRKEKEKEIINSILKSKTVRERG